jgi:putative aldouronate transport system substrate-binding protein
MIGNNSSVEQSGDLPGYQKMRELIGVQINFINVPNSDYKQKKATLLATNDAQDIIQVDVTDLNNYAREGVFHELTGYIAGMKNLKPLYDSIDEVKFQLIDGKVYGLPTISRYEIGRGNNLMHRKDLFDKNNIPTPQTWEEYYQALKKLKGIYPDKIGIVFRNGSRTLVANYGYAMGAGANLYFDHEVNGGTYVYGPAYDSIKDVLAYLARMYQEGLLDKDYISMNSSQLTEKLSNGTGISYYDNPTSCAGNALVALRQIEPDAEWSPMFIPKNEDGFSRSFYSRLQPQLNRIWAVGSNVSKEKLDIIMGMFDWCYSEEGADWLNIGEEGVVFERDFL